MKLEYHNNIYASREFFSNFLVVKSAYQNYFQKFWAIAKSCLAFVGGVANDFGCDFWDAPKVWYPIKRDYVPLDSGI